MSKLNLKIMRRLFKGRLVLFTAFAGTALVAFGGYKYWSLPRQAVAVTKTSSDITSQVASSATAKTVKSNVAIDVLLTKNADASNFGHRVIDASFSLSDDTSKEPLSGRRVMAWMNLEDSPNALPEPECKEAIKSRLAGALTAQAGVNLNQWNLFTMNDDNTISLINPQVSFSKTKLRQLITLAGYPVDWALNKSGTKLFVSIPKKGLITVIDTLKGKIEKNIEVGGKPVRVRSGVGRVLVGNDDGDEVTLINDSSAEVVATLDIGDGHKEIAISPDGKTAVMVSGEDRDVVIVELETRKEISRQDLPAGITSVAYSSQGTVFAVNERLGRVYAGVGGKFDEKRFVESGAGSAVLAVSGNGRWVFVANPLDGKVEIFNAATLERRYTVRGLERPDQIHMTEDYAYLRSGGKPGVALVRLDSLDRQGQPAVSEVQVGTLPPSRSADRGIAPAMAPSPEGSAMVIANPADKTIYFYQEGMMAPAGTIKNYGREPRGVIIADWSIHEKSPGNYQTRAMLPQAGRYDAYVLLSEPRVGVCLKIDVPAEMAMPGLVMETARDLILKADWTEKTRLVAGEKVTMEFDAKLKEGTKETSDLDPESLIVRAFVPPIGPADNLPVRRSGSRYAVDLVPTTEGQLVLLLGSPSRGIEFTRRASVTVGVRAGKSISKTKGANGKSNL
jgi:WD40 repeat protein